MKINKKLIGILLLLIAQGLFILDEKKITYISNIFIKEDNEANLLSKRNQSNKILKENSFSDSQEVKFAKLLLLASCKQDKKGWDDMKTFEYIDDSLKQKNLSQRNFLKFTEIDNLAEILSLHENKVDLDNCRDKEEKKRIDFKTDSSQKNNADKICFDKFNKATLKSLDNDISRVFLEEERYSFISVWDPHNYNLNSDVFKKKCTINSSYPLNKKFLFEGNSIKAILENGFLYLITYSDLDKVLKKEMIAYPLK